MVVLKAKKLEISLLKRYCIPEKACNFIFWTNARSKNMTFKKNLKSKSHPDQKLGQFLFFHCDVNFDKLL